MESGPDTPRPAVSGPPSGLGGQYRAYLRGQRDGVTGWRRAAFGTIRVASDTGRKFLHDRCFAYAASMSYALLVALVPMSVLAFTFFTAFARYHQLRDRVEERIFQYMLPSVGEQLVTLLDQVSQNLRALSLPGLLLFLFSSTILFNSLETSFNAIWGIRRARSYLSKLLISWSILTLVPVLLAGGWVLADQMDLSVQMSGWVVRATTFGFTWAAFAVMLHILPNTRTRLPASLTGAFLGAAIWLASRSAFVWYVGHVSSVQAALGSALATIALFLLWVYFSWVIVLWSAELAYAIQNPRSPVLRPLSAGEASSYRVFHNVLVLAHIGQRFHEGSSEGVDPASVAQALGITPEAARFHIEDLLELELIRRTDRGGFVPARPPADITVAEILRRADKRLLGVPSGASTPAAAALASLFRDATEQTLERLERVDVATLAGMGLSRDEADGAEGVAEG